MLGMGIVNSLIVIKPTFDIKKLILFIPFVSLGQDVNINEYYDDGKKIIKSKQAYFLYW